MRIAYLNHDTSSLTGAGRFYQSFSSAIKKLLPNVQIEALTTENIIYANKFKLIFALPVIRRILSRCDVIHALDGWPYGVIAAWANKTLKKPLIITAIGTGAVKPLYSWWRRPILKWAYRRAFRVIAVSNNTKREILKFLPDLKIEVVNHGVDYERFNNENTKIYESTKIKSLKPYILSVGALKKRKGYEHAIKAFAQIAKIFPDLKYLILGQGSEKTNLQLLITNYQLQNRVVFLNKLSEEEMIALYRNAELFMLLPQDDNKDIEGFGLVFLEAAAAGLPVVATKETSAEDAVRWQPTPTTRTHPNDTNEIIEKELSYKLGKIFFEVHDKLGRFYRERQYADALMEKLSEKGIKFSRELPLKIAGRKSNFADFLIEGKILVELKAKSFIEKQDYYQVLRYLETLGLELGLLVNFRDRHLKPKRILNAKLNKKQFGTFGSNSDSLGRINGILVPPRDYKKAAEAMEKILSDEKSRQKMSAESIKFAKEMSWGKAALAYKKIYGTLA